MILAISPSPVPVSAATIGSASYSDIGAIPLAQSALADPYTLLSAHYITVPPNGTPNDYYSDPISFFPTSGATFAVLTNGNASYASAPNNSGNSGADISGGLVPGRGNTAFDVTILEIGLLPPAGANCLRLDFAFYSEEYPEWVGSAYNDAFIAELDQSTWTTQNRSISAPNNFAFDDQGNVISINSTGDTSMSAQNSVGTTYDGATVLLHAATPITPDTTHKLYLSIFDQGDHVLDSAVFVDNIRMETVLVPEVQCVPGATSTARTPLIFVPGMGGSELDNANGEQWPNIQYVFDDPNDTLLRSLRLDSDGASQYPGTLPIQVGDMLRLQTVDTHLPFVGTVEQDIYDKTIKTFEHAGYTVFPYPYDWRKDIDPSANDLLAFIDDVRDQTSASQVDIMSHSMGGLLTRAVLAKPESVGKVRRVLTLGTPVLGAPILLGMIEYQMPCFLEIPVLGCKSNPVVLQELITNFTGEYQALPGPNYNDAEASPLNIDRDTNGDKLPEGPQSYAQWTSIVRANRNADLMDKNAPFHQAYDDLALADPSVQYYRVVGDQLSTPAQIREYVNCFAWIFNCHVVHEVVLGTGDNTVPLHSADLYNPDRGFDLRNGLPNAYAHRVEHGNLPTNDAVLAFALSYYGSTPFAAQSTTASNLIVASVDETQPRQPHDPWQDPGTGPTMMDVANQSSISGMDVSLETFGLSDTPELFSGIELETLGPVEGAITDNSGHLLGRDPAMPEGVISEAISGGNYNAIADTQSFFLNEDGAYIGRLVVIMQGGIRLRVRTYADGQLNGQATFNVDAPVGAELQIAFATGQDLGTLRLQIDLDGDGVVDSEKVPDAWVVGPAANDRQAPTTTATIHWFASQQGSLVLAATDQPDGSGVAGTYYRIGDSGTSQLYTSPITIPLGAHVRFFSADRAGNTELIQELQTLLIDVKPGSSPNSINLGSKGTVSVAILSTASFDATTLDLQTLTLAGAPVKVKPNGTMMASFEDINHDGRLDLVIHVSTMALQLNTTAIEAILQGETFSGMPVLGVDSVRIVP
ncbi:MAG: choice-of-anchor L domain-containing protein [Anaerolineae bacterium]|nr:choice-of-anchor L domain-containing protein [Anaerolineae bacterium]